jgi:hypothetical protein
LTQLNTLAILKPLANTPHQDKAKEKATHPNQPTARDCKSQTKDHQPHHQIQSHKGIGLTATQHKNDLPSARKSQPQKING